MESLYDKEAEDNKPPYAYCSFDANCELWKDGFQKGAEFGYNKGKNEVEHNLIMKLKDDGIVKVLKDSVFCNKKLSSQEQQELCAWIECAIDFGENLDECAKELEQIRNERNFFKEKCEDIEFNYYCDKLDCQFLSRNKWHYVKDGDLPKAKTWVIGFYYGKDNWHKIFYRADGKWWGEGQLCQPPYAWKEIVLPELKESE